VISVLIPTFNGAADLERCLPALGRQIVDEPVEIVVIDSSSSDGSADVARAHGARTEVIAQAQFDHGRTRNELVALADGDVVVFTSQDAYAEDEHVLARLVAPLRSDSLVAGVYGRQVAHHDASPPERFFMDFLYGDRPRVQRVAGPDELSLETTLFSNACSAIRRDELLAEPFVQDIIMSEDQEWAVRMLLAGRALVYEPAAVVRHSHPYTIAAAFRRFFDSGVSAERAYLAGGGAGGRSALRSSALRYAREETRWLVRSGNARWLPYAAVYELAKFSGLQLGARHRRLPLWLKRRWSALPGYWD